MTAPIRETTDDFVGVHDKRDHVNAAPAGEQRVERCRLRERARKSVEHEALRGVGLLETLGHDRDNQVVADERAALQRVADEDADAGAVLNRLAKNVACGNLGDLVPLGKPVRLRALARARRPEEHQVERHLGYRGSTNNP